MTSLKCFKCEKIFTRIKEYSSHFRRHHAIMVSKSYSSGFYCKQENCDKHFIRFDSLLRHIKKWHIVTDDICNSDIHSSMKSDYSNIQKKIKVQSEEEKIHDSEQYHVCENRNHDEVNCHEYRLKEFDLSMSAQKFIANLRILSGFTGTALTAITNAAQCLVSDISDFIREEILYYCKEQDISIESSNTQALLNKLNFDNLFGKTDTLQDQINTVRNIYNYIDPIEIPLGFRFQQYFDRKEQVWRQKKVFETFHYVPIIETLKLIMSQSSMWNYVHSEQNNSADLLATFKDGISYKQHSFFQRYPHALRIQLYYDDVVVNNPLGSKVHPHKIGAFYFVIQNLPQHINSFLGGIHIFCLCHTIDIQKYGMKAILKPFLLDLNKLESDDGVTVVHNGANFALRASIAAVCADGMAAHQLLGFLSPAAKYFCRLCMINRDDFKNNKNLKDVPLRTKQLYDEQLKEINNRQTLKEIESLKRMSGIQENCALHSSRYFHCTNNFVFDPMHDILEGIAPMELKLVLHYYSTCDDYNFKIDVFNNRVNIFQYGLPENKNKPSANFSWTSIKYQKDYKLSQTAVQTWCLLRVIPFLVSDLVPQNDKHLSLILLLNRINEIVFAPKLRRSILPYLSELIEEHNCLFRELFPAISPINKHHHLTHYPQCISFSGPLRWLNCLRFEAKHNFLKKYGSIVCNFKNITKTLINHCQLYQCAVWGTNEEPRIKLKYVNGRKTYVENTYCRQWLHQMKYQDKDKIIEVNKAEVYGIEYRKDLFVAINSGVQENNKITFGCIKELIILKDDQLWLRCEEWQYLSYNESLNAYCVAQNTDSYTFVNIDELCDLKPFALWSDFKSNLSYIVLRHILL